MRVPLLVVFALIGRCGERPCGELEPSSASPSGIWSEIGLPEGSTMCRTSWEPDNPMIALPEGADPIALFRTRLAAAGYVAMDPSAQMRTENRVGPASPSLYFGKGEARLELALHRMGDGQTGVTAYASDCLGDHFASRTCTIGDPSREAAVWSFGDRRLHR